MSSPPLLCGLALSLLAAPTLTQGVPTPESVFGHAVGADFELISYAESLDYFRQLDASSERLRLRRVGTTSHGRDWYHAIISSPENMANLQRHVGIARRLANAEDADEEVARALAAEGRAIVSIDGGLHSTEAACAQHTVQLAYDLVREDAGAEVERILDEVILVLWFSMNPDGQDMLAEWYERNLGTPFEVSSLPFLYQKYVGHDNNRDGYMNNTSEMRSVSFATLSYAPQVFYNHHQTAPFPARIWIPPFAEPVSSNTHPLMFRSVNLFGTAMAAYLDSHQMPGSIHRGTGFDNWYPGFIDNVNSFRNTVSFLTETALYRYATPKFYTLSDFPSDRRDLRQDVMYASPWQGGWWRIGDAVRYMIGASMSVLDTSSRYREQLLINRWRAGRDTIERFQSGPPYAYVIDQRQWDAGAADRLVEVLGANGLVVHRATEAFELAGREHAVGTRVVRMDQAFARLAKELLEPQSYPEMVQYAGGPPDLPYDVAGWTLPISMHVSVQEARRPLSEETLAALVPLEHNFPDATGIRAPARFAESGAGAALVLSHRRADFAGVVDAAHSAGASVRWIPGEFETPDGPETGALHISGDGLHAVLERARAEGMPVLRTEAEVPEDALSVPATRVGVFRPWQASMDEGWTRWLFDELGLTYESVYNDDVTAGALRERFDVLLIASMGRRTIVDGFQRGTVPPEYAGGVGERGLDELRRFVHQGGTLICFDRAADFALDLLDLDIEDQLDGLDTEEFYCSGSLLGVALEDTSHPLTMGMPEETAAMFDGGSAWETGARFEGRVHARWDADGSPLRSGFLVGADHLRGGACLVEAEYGDGRAVLFGFRPQWRAQSHATFKLILNALSYGQELAAQVAQPRAPREPELEAWGALEAELEGALTALVEAEEDELDAALARFREGPLVRLAQLKSGLEDAAARGRVGDYAALVEALLVSLRSIDLDAAGWGAHELFASHGLPEAAREVRRALGD